VIPAHVRARIGNEHWHWRIPDKMPRMESNPFLITFYAIRAYT
jgi:hypothetical protein